LRVIKKKKKKKKGPSGSCGGALAFEACTLAEYCRPHGGVFLLLELTGKIRLARASTAGEALGFRD